MKDQFVADKIQEMDIEIGRISQIVASAQPINEAQYSTWRKGLNKIVIQALTGLEWPQKKNGTYKAGKSHKLPTMSQIAEIASRMETLTNGLERNILQRFAEERQNSDPNDTQFPAPPVPTSSIAAININLKMKDKELREILIGNEESIANTYFGGAQCNIIVVIGERIRKNKNIKLALIIGGIALILAVGVIAGLLLWSAHKKKMEAIGDESIVDKLDNDPDMIALHERVMDPNSPESITARELREDVERNPLV